jgi:hypothetical protein
MGNGFAFIRVHLCSSVVKIRVDQYPFVVLLFGCGFAALRRIADL